jgi:hypothetical protein
MNPGSLNPAASLSFCQNRQIYGSDAFFDPPAGLANAVHIAFGTFTGLRKSHMGATPKNFECRNALIETAYHDQWAQIVIGELIGR